MSTEYFSHERVGTPDLPGRFVDVGGQVSFPITDGVSVRTVVGHDVMVNLVELDRGGEAPMHAHGEEQIVLVLEGAVDFQLEDEHRILRPGDAIVVPSWVSHGAIGHAEHSRTVEVFSPPRAALLELMGLPFSAEST